MKTRILFLMAFAVFCLLPPSVAGCNPCKRIERLQKKCPPVASTRDSIYIHDTVIRTVYVIDTLEMARLKAEIVYLKGKLSDTLRGETSYTKATAFVDNQGMINLLMQNKDSAEVYLKRIKELELRLHTMESYHAETEVKEVKYVPKPTKFFAGVGVAFVILLVLYAIYRIAKRVIKAYLKMR